MYYEKPHEFVAGDYYQICDECGRKIRKSESKRRWDGLIVCPADFEQRHPQEEINYTPTEKVAVDEPRPRPTDIKVTVSTEVATAAVAGATSVVVDSTSGMADGYSISIQLNGGDLHTTTINGTPTADTITITDALTGAVAVNNAVIAYLQSGLISQSDL